jgi:hypothetical protein
MDYNKLLNIFIKHPHKCHFGIAENNLKFKERWQHRDSIVSYQSSIFFQTV